MGGAGPGATKPGAAGREGRRGAGNERMIRRVATGHGAVHALPPDRVTGFTLCGQVPVTLGRLTETEITCLRCRARLAVNRDASEQFLLDQIAEMGAEMAELKARLRGVAEPEPPQALAPPAAPPQLPDISPVTASVDEKMVYIEAHGVAGYRAAVARFWETERAAGRTWVQQASGYVQA